MKRFVILPLSDGGAKIFDRSKSDYIILSQQGYDYLYLNRNTSVPIALVNKMQSLWQVSADNSIIDDVFLFREAGTTNFETASWEVTHSCNFRCEHCLIDEKIAFKKFSPHEIDEILKTLVWSGIYKIQITGGEPLIDISYFSEIYKRAYELGLIVTVSTNGSLISKSVLDLWHNYPPLRVVVSLYGATNKTYQKFTRSNNNFDDFLNNLNSMKDLGISLRLNIIISNKNSHEKDLLVNLAKKFTDDYYLFDNFSPTLGGSTYPTELSLNNDLFSSGSNNGSCWAGKKSLHIEPNGMAMICQQSRGCKISLLDHKYGFAKVLSLEAVCQLQYDEECDSCNERETCNKCPVMIRNYKKSGVNKSIFCPKGGEKCSV